MSKLMLCLTLLCLPLFSGCGPVRSTVYDKPLVIQCPAEVMEACVPPEPPSSDQAMVLISKDDAENFGLFEECVLRQLAVVECFKKLKKAGIIRDSK